MIYFWIIVFLISAYALKKNYILHRNLMINNMIRISKEYSIKVEVEKDIITSKCLYHNGIVVDKVEKVESNLFNVYILGNQGLYIFRKLPRKLEFIKDFSTLQNKDWAIFKRM